MTSYVYVLQSMMGNDDIHQIYDKVSREIEQHLAAFQAAVPSAQQTAAIRTLLEYVLHARQSVRDMNPALALIHRAVEGLLDGFAVPATGPEQELMLRYRDCHLLVIRALQDPRVHGLQWTNKHVTRYLHAKSSVVLNRLKLIYIYIFRFCRTGLFFQRLLQIMLDTP